MTEIRERAATAADSSRAEPRRTRWRPQLRLSTLLSSQSTLIFMVLIAIAVLFTVIAPTSFPQPGNLRLVAQNAAILLVLGVGATFVIITGGIDLSVASVLVFSGVTSSWTMQRLGGEGWAVALAGLAVALGSGVLWGLINGLLVAKAKVPSMIVTLGTMGIALGIALVLTGGVDISGAPAVLEDNIGYGHLPFGIPVLVVIAVATAVVGAILLRTTRFGINTRAIGSNLESARRAGVKVSSHLVKVYVLAGACAGLGGLLSIAQFSTTAISGHKDAALMVITAVILGGTSLFGGVGTIFGTVIGVLIPAVLQDGFVIVGIEPFWQPVVTGVVLVVAVYIDRIRRSKSDVV